MATLLLFVISIPVWGETPVSGVPEVSTITTVPVSGIPAITVPLTTVPITADSWVVADGTGKIIQETNGDEVKSIASISKLVTAMIVLDAHQNPDQKLHFPVRKRQMTTVSREEALQLALVKSSNGAADALCNAYPGGRKNCIAAMNDKVAELGLTNTHFSDPTGLNPRNVSTAKELIKIVLAAQNYPEIVQAASTSTLTVKVKYKHKRKIRVRTMDFHNTNHDVGNGFFNFIISKTGFIHKAGACIVILMETDTGKRVVVLLNSKSTKTRVSEAEYIANYAGGIL